jgi:hypothetical protein
MSAEVHTVRPPGAPDTGGWLFRPYPKMPEQWRSPEAQDQLLHEWLISMQSIPLFAKNHGLTVDQLFDWLHSEIITDRRKRLECMAAQRAESLARLNLPDAIGTLAATMRDPNALPKERRLAASAIVRYVTKADKELERATSPTALRQTLADEDDARASTNPERKRAGRDRTPEPTLTDSRATAQPALTSANDHPPPLRAKPAGRLDSPSQSPTLASSAAAPRAPRTLPASKPVLARIGIRRNRAGSSRPPRQP